MTIASGLASQVEHAMSTVDEPRTNVLPPLVAGQRLDQPTFHERYEAMPPETRAELVGGVVYMPSPHAVTITARPSRIVSGWLFHYQRYTPGVDGGDDAHRQARSAAASLSRTAIFASRRSWADRVDVDDEGYHHRRTRAGRRDRPLQPRVRPGREEGRLRAGRRLGIRGRRARPRRVHWFIRRDDRFEDLPPGPDGVYRSEVFPGLWLDPEALFAEDRIG